MTTEIYVSTDVEADGPIPGPYSMLSFGSAAYLADKTLIGTFTANLETLPGASQHPETMAWWDRHPVAWAACREDPQAPEEAIPAYAAWLESLPGQPTFVSYPVAYDFMFMTWYLVRFTRGSPFGHAGLDIRSLAMAVLGGEYRGSGKRHMPPRWFDDDQRHSHNPLDDALEQGALLCNILAELRG